MNTGFKISTFIGYLTTFMFLHYFYTYCALYFLLGENGIDAGKVICLDDIKFSLSPSSTISIIFISVIGLGMIYIWHMAYSDENKQLAKFRKQYNQRYSLIFKYFRKSRRRISPKSIRQMIDVLLILFVFTIIFILEVWRTELFIALFFILGLIILPAIFILYKSKRKFTLYVYFLFLFVFGMFFVKYTNNYTTDENQSTNIIEITSFIYHGDTIKTSQTYKLGFLGAENIVLVDTAAGIIDYFERGEVSHIRFKKVKLEEFKPDSLALQLDSLVISQFK